jgi:G3E family GTPase
MKTEKHDPLGEQFLRRQAEIVRQRDEFKPGPLTEGWGKDSLTAGTENLPAFDPSKVSLGPNANVPRIKRQELPSLEVIRELLAELANDLEVSKADYATTSLDEYFAPQKAAEAKVADLRRQLAAAEIELEHATRPHPHEAFKSFVCESEQRMNSIAGLLLTKLVDEESRRQFKVPAERLDELVRKSLALQFEDRLRRFVVNFYQRTHRMRQPSDAQLNERAEQILADVQQIVAENL